MIDPLIRKLEQFQPLSPEERAALETMPSRLREYRRGEVLIEAGTCADESALLLRGCVFRFKLTPDSRRQIVSIQVPGDFVDLHSFVLQPIDHSVAAATPSIVARVPHRRIAELLDKFPHLTRNLMWDIALDGAIFREWLVTMGQRSAVEQIAHLFCELYLRLERVSLVKDGSFDFALTQQDLAETCGMSAVHVNRSVQTLREKRLIVLDHKRLTVLSLGKLIEFANFDPAYLRLLK